ncbi:hypothetical protein [Streptomyces sp. RerS4]|uniref:hypothetical protein n=1 Tax=Streptomyces sp. RerS4 TaxID=2942449 RepID=UPI00201B9D07|nr:hypothetical protein [Streptomyces sp. RerS4]UQX02359.1 hypothetical protein M4D82_19095 [Streptomyces sp. RerS4]
MPTPPAPTGHPPRWAWWVIGIVIPVMGTVVTLLATANKPDTPPRAAHPPVTTPSTPPASPSPPPSRSAVKPLPGAPSPSTGTPAAPGPQDLTAPAGYQVQEGRWGIAPPACGETLLVDLDAGVSTTVKVDVGDDPSATQTQTIELEYRPDATLCSTGDVPYAMELRSVTGRQVGVIRPGRPQSFEECRAAAGTGFGPVKAGNGRWTSRGLTKGAAVCAVTDKGSVAMALFDDENEDPRLPVVSGKLIVWSKS